MNVMEFLFGGLPPERRLPEVIAWTFPGVAFFAAFPMGKVGMGIYQWLLIGGALAVGSRVLAGFPMFGLKLKGKKLTDLRALTSVTIGVAALGCCAMSQEDFGWNWKVYVGAVLAMSIISFCATFKAAEDLRKQRKKQGIGSSPLGPIDQNLVRDGRGIC